MILLPLVQLLLAQASLASPARVEVNIPTVAPSKAVLLSRSLISLSVEQDRWTEWAGTDSPNAFFRNTLANIGNLTGIPPCVRIGANSEDHTDFDYNVQYSETTFRPPSVSFPFPEATEVVVGDEFYQVASHLPNGTHVIWGLNLRANNLTSTYLNAVALVRAFKSPEMKAANISLEYIELGNEPDLYYTTDQEKEQKNRWNIDEYVKRWSSFAQNVSQVVGMSTTSQTRLLVGGFSGSTHDKTGFSPQSFLGTEIVNDPVWASLRSFSQHHYSGTFCFGANGLLQDLMSKSSIRDGLAPFKPDIAAINEKGLEYNLGETNSYSCHGAPNVSNTAGAALWTLDYALYAAQIGVSRLFFHEGIGYKYNLIQPVPLTISTTSGQPLEKPLQPHVQPQYYAAIIVAEAIGRSGNTTAIELTAHDDDLSGYAFYENGKLRRALFINSRAYLTTDKARGIKHIDLSFDENQGFPSPQTIGVKRLKIGHADDTSGLRWGNQTYETDDGRVQGTLQTTTSSCAAGIDISDTEVVLVTFF